VTLDDVLAGLALAWQTGTEASEPVLAYLPRPGDAPPAGQAP
jgi:hypothetical protein